MRVPRIYTEQALSEHSNIELEEGPSHHILKVLRMQVGRELILFNGDGFEFLANIQATSKKHATIQTGSHTVRTNESPLHTHLAIGVSRGERFDWVLQKATELGVNEITPIFSARCEVKLKGERLDKRVQSWTKILISACEQCERNTLPTLNAPETLEEFSSSATADLKLVLHHRDATSLGKLHEKSPSAQSCCFLIGPEGGLSEQEIKHAQNQHFKALTLGPRVLRTETAPIAALSAFQLLWGDF